MPESCARWSVVERSGPIVVPRAKGSKAASAGCIGRLRTAFEFQGGDVWFVGLQRSARIVDAKAQGVSGARGGWSDPPGRLQRGGRGFGAKPQDGAAA